MNRRSLALAVSFIAAIALGSPAANGVAFAAEEFQLVNGQPQEVTGETGVTFWKTKHPFLLLIDSSPYEMLSGDASVLLEGAWIEAPPQVTVQQQSLTAVPQKVSRSYTTSPGNVTTTQTYDEYRIAGSWTLTVAPGTDSSTLNVTIHLPAVAKARDALDAAEPEGETAIVLPIKTFLTTVSRANERVTGDFFKGLGCLLLVTVAVAGLGGGLWFLTQISSLRDLSTGLFMLALAGIGIWYGGPAFVTFMGRAIDDLREIHLAAAIGAAAGVNLAYFGLFWFAAGWGRWNSIWTRGLGGALAFFVAAAGVILLLPPNIPRIAELRTGLPAAISTMLPGLALAWLAALRYRPSDRKLDPTAEQGLADVCRYLADVPRRNS